MKTETCVTHQVGRLHSITPPQCLTCLLAQVANNEFDSCDSCYAQKLEQVRQETRAKREYNHAAKRFHRNSRQSRHREFGNQTLSAPKFHSCIRCFGVRAETNGQTYSCSVCDFKNQNYSGEKIPPWLERELSTPGCTIA